MKHCPVQIKNVAANKKKRKMLLQIKKMLLRIKKMPAVPCTADYTIDPISVETGSIVRPDDLKAILETLRSQFLQLILYTTPVDKS